MSCANCLRHVTEALQGVPGVANVTVALESGCATVHWSPGVAADVAALLDAVRAAGYDAQPLSAPALPTTTARRSPLGGWRLNVVLGGLVTAVLMLAEWVMFVSHARWFQWLAFALVLPVQFVCGARFYQGAWRQLKAGGANMDTLVALGSSTAFLYSTWGLFAGWRGHLYFMEAAGIITLISAGHWLESIASAKAASSLRALLNLAPHTARRLNDTGTETEVPIATLRIGDTVVLKPGDRVPTDGVVLEGASAVDESMLTGESAPVDKAPSLALYAGTVNQNGHLKMRVTATGAATALAHIITVVQRAQTSRAAIQKLGDRVSGMFVPLVVLLAIGAGLWWGLAYETALRFSGTLVPWLWPTSFPDSALAAAFIHAASVLIVACPCAMGLATPAAIMAGTNAAARRGILIRDGEALEKTGRITAVIFDKTGTLTQAKVTVEEVADLRSADQPPISEIGASLTKPSNHPLSQAVAQYCREHYASSRQGADPHTGTNAPPEPTLALVNWTEMRGRGVQADWISAERPASVTLRLGSWAWLQECGVDLAPADAFTTRWSEAGATVLGLAANSQLLAAMALRDTLKPGATDVVAQLMRQRKTVYLITGDNHRTAMTIANQLGLVPDRVFAEIRPEHKAAIVERLQQCGERVAFVGDGINDAPALEQADLGIAVSRASDVAREAADIILLKSDIHAIPEALGLAQATMRTIRQNLFWAFFYNAAAIPLAVLGFLSPMLCAAAMGFSDLIVIGNALRLFTWKHHRESKPNLFKQCGSRGASVIPSG
jgi:Cu+-exporting ATPase